MSTTLSTPVSPSFTMPNRVNCPASPKFRPRSYSPWPAPMSERQINSYFEQHILPKLSVLLEGSFQELPDFEREEAVQDSVCQALEAFRVLRLYENICKNTACDETALVLTKFASSQYLAGVRFANPRATSCL